MPAWGLMFTWGLLFAYSLISILRLGVHLESVSRCDLVSNWDIGHR